MEDNEKPTLPPSVLHRRPVGGGVVFRNAGPSRGPAPSTSVLPPSSGPTPLFQLRGTTGPTPLLKTTSATSIAGTLVESQREKIASKLSSTTALSSSSSSSTSSVSTLLSPVEASPLINDSNETQLNSNLATILQADGETGVESSVGNGNSSSKSVKSSHGEKTKLNPSKFPTTSSSTSSSSSSSSSSASSGPSSSSSLSSGSSTMPAVSSESKNANLISRAKRRKSGHVQISPSNVSGDGSKVTMPIVSQCRSEQNDPSNRYFNGFDAKGGNCNGNSRIRPENGALLSPSNAHGLETCLPKRKRERMTRQAYQPEYKNATEFMENLWDDTERWFEYGDDDLVYLEKLAASLISRATIALRERSSLLFEKASAAASASTETLEMPSTNETKGDIKNGILKSMSCPPPACSVIAGKNEVPILSISSSRGGFDEVSLHQLRGNKELSMIKDEDMKIFEDSFESFDHDFLDVHERDSKHSLGNSAKESFEKLFKSDNKKIFSCKEFGDGVSDNTKVPSKLSLLGKRGRWYKEVWDEEDFLLGRKLPKKKAGELTKNINANANIPDENMLVDTSRIEIIRDLSELLESYSDNHDGSCRAYNLKTSSSSSPSSDGNLRFAPPPVPVSVQHPAAWGLGARTSCAINVNIMHPAAASSTILQTPGQIKANENHTDLDGFALSAEHLLTLYESQEILNLSILMKLHRRITMHKKLETLRAKRTSLGTKLAEIMLSRVAHNQGSDTCPPSFVYRPNTTFVSFESTSSGASHVESDPNTDSSSLAITSDAAEPASTSTSSASSVEPQTEKEKEKEKEREAARGKTLFSFSTIMTTGRYTTRNVTGSLIRNRWADDDLSWAINESLYMNSVNAHGGMSSSKPLNHKAKNVEVKELLGAALMSHVPHASFIASIDKGHCVEFMQTNYDWTIGIVQNRLFDARVFVRQIKIMPLGGAPGDSMWICVEDGRLAPIGTNISYQAFLAAVQLCYNVGNSSTSQAKMTLLGNNNDDLDEIMITI